MIEKMIEFVIGMVISSFAIIIFSPILLMAIYIVKGLIGELI